jgi:hypothetical protein
MELTGGCYCGEIRDIARSKPRLHAQCHCRECQYFSGGAPNLFMLIQEARFNYTAGAATAYSRPDLPQAVTREFCPRCGTHLISRRPGLDAIIVKIGTLDNPKEFAGAQIAVFTVDQQPFHHIPDTCRAFERLPPKAEA